MGTSTDSVFTTKLNASPRRPFVLSSSLVAIREIGCDLDCPSAALCAVRKTLVSRIDRCCISVNTAPGSQDLGVFNEGCWVVG